MDQKIKVQKVVQTCVACPSQWDVWDEDGVFYYIRYRGGRGTILKDNYETLVFQWEGPDGLDGYISWAELMELCELFDDSDAEYQELI